MSARTLAWSLAALLLLPATAGAAVIVGGGGDQNIAFDRPESWAMKYFASASLLTDMGPPRALRFGHVRLALEGGWIPHLDADERTVGFNGTKQEDLNKLPVFGRVRFTLGLPARLSLTFGWVPPIEINGVTSDLFALALSRPFALPHHFTVGVTLYGQAGDVEGDFTCPEAWLHDAARNPLGCTRPSHDEVTLNYFGASFSASERIVRAHGLEPYAAVAVNYLDLRFRVNAAYDDALDFTRLETEGATFSMNTGLLFPITRHVDVATELFYSPLTVHRPGHETSVDGLMNVRAMLAVGL